MAEAWCTREIKRLNMQATSEGLALFDGTRYAYQYNLTDHLGDVQTVVDTSGSVVQSTDYYPFGLAHATSSLDKNKYLYNGKELQSEVLGGTAFGMLDYGARFYDPVVSRWHGVDPLAEKSSRWSTYSYAYDNPMRFIDPDGKEPQIGGKSGGKSSGGGESGGLAAVAKAIGSFFGLDNITRQTPAERIEYADRRASLEVVKDDMEKIGNAVWAPIEAVVPGGTVLSKMVKREEVTVEDVGIEAAFLFLPGGKTGKTIGYEAYGVTSVAVRSALADRVGKRGFTIVGYQFNKHAGRVGVGDWLKAIPEGAKLNPETYNKAGYETFKEIWRTPSSFQKVGNFWEKRLPDGRGIRLQDNFLFKGFLD